MRYTVAVGATSRQHIDLEALQIRRMEAADAEATFASGDDDLDAFLRESAWPYFERGAGKTHVAVYDGSLVGYMTLLADAVRLHASDRRKIKGYSQLPVIPAVKIGRLAVDQAFRASFRGLGEALVKTAIALALQVGDSIGARLLTVDAYRGSVAFYEKQGFKPNKQQSPDASTVGMHLDLHGEHGQLK